MQAPAEVHDRVPFVVVACTAKVRGSPFTSVPARVIVPAVPRGAEATVWAVAVGAVLSMTIATVPGSEVAGPLSDAVKVNESAPLVPLVAM